MLWRHEEMKSMDSDEIPISAKLVAWTINIPSFTLWASWGANYELPTSERAPKRIEFSKQTAKSLTQVKMKVAFNNRWINIEADPKVQKCPIVNPITSANSTFQPTELNSAVWMPARAHRWLKGIGGGTERGAFSAAMETSSSELGTKLGMAKRRFAVDD